MILGFLMPLASILTWMERRQSSMMQDRLGPNRANIPLPWKWNGKQANWRMWGITHFMADALKFLFKEDYVPGKAHKFLFMWAPVMAMAPALIVAAIIPFGPPLCWGELLQTAPACGQPVGLQIARLDIGLLFYFAIASLSVYGATLAGWASHNKWSMMGGLRATSQMMSYEVTMGMAVLGSFLVYGSLEPGAMADQQTHILSLSHYASSWGIFTQPAGFILFLTAAIAETKRTPFDIPEGEPGDHRLLRRVLGAAVRHVLPGRVPGDRHLQRHHDHHLLRWLALGRLAGRHAAVAPAERAVRAGRCSRCGPPRCSRSARSSF